jgi:hypothetical protein
MLYYMLDTCLVNSYLIWRKNRLNLTTEAHRKFRESISKALRNMPHSEVKKTTDKRCYSYTMPLPNKEALSHQLVRLEARGYCVWCKEHAEEWVPKRTPVLGELVNGEQVRKRSRQSRSY